MEDASAEESAMPGESSEFDPKEATRVLQEATRQARRRFDLKRPLLSVSGGAVIFLPTEHSGFQSATSTPTKVRASEQSLVSMAPSSS